MRFETEEMPLLHYSTKLKAVYGNIGIYKKYKHRSYSYTAGGFVWYDRPFYLVKQPQEKWMCDFHDDALPFSFQLQVAEVIF